MISLEAIQAVCGSKRPMIEEVYPFLIEAMQKYQVDTPLRQAMFLAQGIHETAGFKYMREIASGAAYEGRADLGNTQAGDGERYPGRGIFQTTGRSNYARTSMALFGNLKLLELPELLEEPEWAAKSAGLYWDWKVLNKPADARDVVTATKKINGGTNGLPQRLELYRRMCLVQGI